uniref:ShKT domain-containing protein n=1 Tax=Steinernema glaseri TaxID=37863 RepID=A0A1I7YP83_9BILA
MFRPVLLFLMLAAGSAALHDPPCLLDRSCELAGQVCDLNTNLCVWEDDKLSRAGGCSGGCPQGEGCSITHKKCFKTCSSMNQNMCPVGTSCSLDYRLCLPGGDSNGNRGPNVPGAQLPSANSNGANGQCEDLHAPGRTSDCPRLKRLCDDKLYYDVMTVQCPKTCGRCPKIVQAKISRGNSAPTSNGNKKTDSSSCVDFNSSECIQKRHLCGHSLYTEVMRKQCPNTCGFC